MKTTPFILALLVCSLSRAEVVPAVKAVQPVGRPQASTIPAASPVQTSSTPAQTAMTTASAISTSESPVDSILNEDLIKALRDPFQVPAILMSQKESPKTDLELYQLKDFKLNGVVTGPKKTRAMITVPTGKVFFIKVGDAIGTRDGKVTQILNDSIKVMEYYTDEHGKKTPDIYELNLMGEFLSLSKREESL